MTRSWLKFLAAVPALVLPVLGGSLGVAPAMAVGAPTAAEAAAEDPDNARVIVKYRAGSALMQRAGSADKTALASATVRPQHAAALSTRLGLVLRDGRVLGARTQGLRASGLSSSALAQRLAAQPDVEWAQVDQRRTIAAAASTPPNDPLFGPDQTSTTPVVGQWYLRAPDATVKSAINALGAWAISTGSAGVTVAVLDTGVRYDHPDLAGKLWPGYDFVTSTTVGADGDGRDDDANDPGDGTSACNTSTNLSACSSWHGTQVAGLIGAATDNGIGMAGVGRNVMVLPVRVLGVGGGFDSDIVAGLRWAAGLSNEAGCTASSARSATCNPHPAKVINMSLGSTGTCSARSNTSYFDAINEVTAAGALVVVAAGNQTGLAVNVPANCPGAVAVAAVRHVGTKVGFSSLGPEVAISAPGGNCVNTTGACLYPLLSTTNAGSTTPTTSTYSTSFSYEVGTSFSAPLVAGTAALMLSVDPTLSPAALTSALKTTARAFPSTGALSATATACRAPTTATQDECYCTTSTCGAGMLDAAAALARVGGLKVVLSPSASVVNAGGAVTVGSGGTTLPAGRSIASYAWTVTGEPATGFAITTATTNPELGLRLDAAGSYVVSLAVTDSAGLVSRGSTTLGVAASPSAVIGVPGNATVGQTLTVGGTGSTADSANGRTIAQYAWSLGSNSVGASIVGSASGNTVVVSASSAGSFPLSLTVTDSGGLTATTLTNVTVVAAPVVATPTSSGGGSGGGAMGAGWLVGLALAVLALARTPRP